MDCATSDGDGSRKACNKELNVTAAAKPHPESSYSDTEIDHGKSVYPEGTVSAVETADNLSIEQEIDDVTNEQEVDDVTNQQNVDDVTNQQNVDDVINEQNVDDVTNKHMKSDPEGGSHEVASLCTVGENHSSPLTELEPTNEGQSVGTQEREERDSQFQGERNGVESPASDDRNLEQFSEVLLDSDSSLSDHEAGTDDRTDNKKDGKRVRFADEVSTSGNDEGNKLSDHPAPGSISPLASEPTPTGVPVNQSLMSPQQPVSPCQHTVDELIRGVEYPAKYLGSTPILLSGIGAIKSARMHQAQQAVKLIKDPESDSRPQFEVGIRISTKAVKIVDSKANIDLMEHPLHTISYVADIEGVVVIMAHLGPVLDPSSSPSTPDRVGVSLGSYTPKITCHVLDAENARQVARVIGQAFTAAYKEFLRSSGVTEETLEEAEYAHILSAQTMPQAEVETLSDRSKLKKITMAKSKGESLGIMVMEAGYGSAIPACVVAHLSKTGAALKSGLLNVGDHIISINGVSLVGMPTKSCVEQIKKCRPMNIVKMVVCSIPAVVDITIVRPDLKYQLGFSVHEGMICSIIRGSIGERSGVRIGHRIIDINGTSTVNMSHQDIVHLLSCTVGDLQIRTMPDLMYKLLTGQVLPEYY